MQGGTDPRRRLPHWAEGILLTLLLGAFGFLSPKAVYGALVLLAVSAWIMSRHLTDTASARAFFGLKLPPHRRTLWVLIGILTGAGAWAGFYLIPGNPLPVPGLGWFAFSALAIGLAEELVYRGFLYSVWKSYGVLAAIGLTAMGHTLYKVALLAPYQEVDLLPVTLWTLAAGVALGAMRHFSRSVMPAALNHMLFDVLVYGAAASGPAWVW